MTTTAMTGLLNTVVNSIQLSIVEALNNIIIQKNRKASEYRKQGNPPQPAKYNKVNNKQCVNITEK